MSTSVRSALPQRPGVTSAKQRLLEGALGLFSRVGYHGVSVRDIAKELDQHPTSLYAHVSSKQELLFELVRAGHEELRDQVRLALLEADGTPGSQLRAIVRANVLTHLSFPDLVRVSHNEFRHLSAQQAAVIEVLRVDLGTTLREVVSRGVALGVFAPPDAAVTVAAIVAMSTRVVDWWSPSLGVDPEHVATTQAELAVRMLRPA